MVKIDCSEYLHNGYIIQKQDHFLLKHKYSIFKNNQSQNFIGNALTITEAMKMYEKYGNEKDNYHKYI